MSFVIKHGVPVQLTVLELLDPDVWTQVSHEANADLFVSWDALGLTRMGADYADHGRALRVTGPSDAWFVCRSHERTLRQWADLHLGWASRVRVLRVWAETYLAPVAEALIEIRTDAGWQPFVGTRSGDYITWDWPPGRAEETSAWEGWVRRLVDAWNELRDDGPQESPISELERGRLAGVWANDYDGIVYLLSGIAGPHEQNASQHWNPLIPGATWGDVLEGMRWIVLMAWLSELQGECP